MRTAFLYDFVNFRRDVNLIFLLSIFSSQDKYVAVAVYDGLLEVFFNVNGMLTNYMDPQDSRIKISNAQPKFVSESLYLFQFIPAKCQDCTLYVLFI